MSGSEKHAKQEWKPSAMAGFLRRLPDLPADSWPVRKPQREKTANKVRRKMGDRHREPTQLIKITDMHTMQLVNTIKLMLRCAKAVIYSSKPFTWTSNTPLQVLAHYDHWKSLLDEGYSRKLKLIFWLSAGSETNDGSDSDKREVAPWYKEARAELERVGRA